jgi:hypothetical protein
MKVKVVLSAITMIVGIAGFSFFQSSQAHAMRDIPEPNHSGSEQAKILGATLQIEISVPVDANGEWIAKAKGLGSLVWDGEKNLLVTHNHWGEVLQEKSVVVFYDAKGRMVKTMSGFEFIRLRCYLDAGSLILRSPLEGMEQAQNVIAGDPLQVQAGDIVLVAQREDPERKEATLVEAEVESVTTIQGVPVFRLKGLGGRPVQTGDSGGGVWRDGKLVGNLWNTIMAESTRFTLFSLVKPDEANLEATDGSSAAIVPARQLKALQESSASNDEKEMSAVP